MQCLKRTSSRVPILEKTGTTIGVVTGIQGAYWLDVTLDGVACHAGPTPMEMRRDPWRAACPIIEGAFALAAANRTLGPRDDRGRQGASPARATPYRSGSSYPSICDIRTTQFWMP